MGEYGMRGKAAERSKKKQLPPEEAELGLPPMDEGLPPEGGPEAGGGDLMALLGAAGGGPPPEMPDEGAPPEAGGMPPEPMDLEGALAGVDSALQGMPPEQAEEIRVHLNAIRDIAAGGAGGAPPMDAAGAAPGGVPGEVPPSEEIPA